MSKFDEFCAAVEIGRARFEQYKNDSFSFAELLFQNIQSYFEIPLDHISYYSLNYPDGFERATNNIESAIDFDVNNGNWNLGLRLNLSMGKPLIIIVRILFKKEKDNFIVKLGKDLKETQFRIMETDQKSFIPFLDHFAHLIINEFTTIPERYINLSNGLAQIGFS